MQIGLLDGGDPDGRKAGYSLPLPTIRCLALFMSTGSTSSPVREVLSHRCADQVFTRLDGSVASPWTGVFNGEDPSVGARADIAWRTGFRVGQGDG